ncbi:LysR family transcriptional regulator [Bacillus sp. AFS031507]|uniref:LysR family transcriptional regulator n=1 Tax=Bacillus sp. AFS031507 TaxID=2033496 RepID=UPI000BFDAED0|nr:LysR family transcriptional regulator [Bacillus sp. AFS031507]PGY09105.1 LysR family transcriptional regulator [Bacillus sp. AFS031507]
MELRHLRYFVAVAEELHFGKAASRLNISQPPLSMQINQLEGEIGAKLFFRTKHHVELTDAGRIFLEQTYQILEKLEKACIEAAKIHRGEVGQLVIGFTGSLSSQQLQFLRQYRSRFPEVEVILKQMSTTDQVKALLEKRIHFGMLCPPIENNLLNFHIVHRVPFIAAIPSTHPLASETSPLDIRDLKNESFIISPRNIEPGYHDSIISICHQAGFTPKISQEAEGIFTILTLVAAELGVALVTTLVLDHPKQGVVFRDLKDSQTTMDLFLAWRKNDNLHIVDSFLTVFNEFFKVQE